ncbi:MAG: transcription antitermination factor NusB [Pseudomonadota bacterium]|nr:transcription antitermination factor NusB [Pseudomonadota bacterium]
MLKAKKTKRPSSNNKSAARLLAVQALYQISLTQKKYENVLKEFVAFRIEKRKVDVELFKMILTGVSKEGKNIDKKISALIKDDWNMGRIEPVILSILRSGIFELGEQKDSLKKVIINEYINIAHSFFNGKEPAFINAILDKVTKEKKA